MRKRLFDWCGILHLELNIILEAKQEDGFKKWRDCILSELEDYVGETKRFITQEQCQ